MYQDPLLELQPVLIVKVGTQSVTLTRMFQPWAAETTILKNTVLFNLHNRNTVKAYPRTSLYFFDADMAFRRNVIWLVESR